MEKKQVWQRLYKVVGSAVVYSEFGVAEDNPALNLSDEEMAESGLVWLCPKPNLVSIDDKTLSNYYKKVYHGMKGAEVCTGTFY